MNEIPIALPPRLAAMREPRFTYPIPVNRGPEVNFNTLQPGTHYYLQSSEANPMNEIEFVERVEGRPRSFRARFLPRLIQRRNRSGNPLSPVYEPRAPGPRLDTLYEGHAWPHTKFYKVQKAKRIGTFIHPAIVEKMKKNTRRRSLNRSLNKAGISSELGSGPSNIIRQFSGLQPPKGTASYGPARKTRKGGKRRLTKKQRGGADIKRIRKNVIAASKLGSSDDSNLYYSVEENDITKGQALVIAPRYSGITDAEKKAAKYPYEECLFFFDVNLGGDPPNDYPNAPPKLKHQTPAIGKNYRLHPNLYEFSPMEQYSGKVCLGILGTWGNNDWKSTMSISEVLQGIMGILEANPGTYEPGCMSYTDKNLTGILYNTHVMYESIELTCKAYEKVFKALTLGANNSLKFENANVKRESISPFMKPFLDILAKRGFSALTFLIGKVEEFIRVNGGKTKMQLNEVMHHTARLADFGALKECLERVKASIPKALQKNIFKYGVGETHRALFELSKPMHPSGRPMTYQEFVEEIQERERLKLEAEKEKKKAELGVNSCPSGNNGNEEENAASYVYSNQGNENQNNLGENEEENA
jgi:ubiquitin-protein ligase